MAASLRQFLVGDRKFASKRNLSSLETYQLYVTIMLVASANEQRRTAI